MRLREPLACHIEDVHWHSMAAPRGIAMDKLIATACVGMVTLTLGTQVFGLEISERVGNSDSFQKKTLKPDIKALTEIDCINDAGCVFLIPDLYEEFAGEILQSLSRLDSTDCKSESWRNAQTTAETLILFAQKGAVSYQAYIKGNGRNSASSRLGATMHDAFDKSAEVKLEVADRATKSGCIEIAEAEYRYVLSRYTAPEQQGYQRRAAAGLEEIRSKKGSFMCSWFGHC
jgi:hypothetical protein